jgi:iron complex transport system substrate-binding protein
MATDATGRTAPTRRGTIVSGGAVVVGLLAGCTDESNGGEESDDENSPTSSEDDSYTVSMEPMGETEFEEIPERWATYKEAQADMGIALGIGEGLVGIDSPEDGLDPLIETFYSEIPGVSLDTGEMTNIRADGENIDKEVFYEMDADVHLIDPNEAMFRFEWDDNDLEEIEEIAPFFGHSNRRYTYDWQDDYTVHSLYETFEKTAEVFGREERYEAFEALHNEVIDELDSVVGDEPTEVGLLNGGSEADSGLFYLLDPLDPGYEMKQYRDLSVENAFESVDAEDGEADYEVLLDVDPEIIIYHWGVLDTDEEFEAERIAPMESHPVGSELTAVQEGRVYPGGTAEQGPILNLFQTEFAAQQLYPDTYGGEELFSRQEVADIINGDR